MAENPITVPLPADLPIDWKPNQIISPDGTSAGYTEQHGYNYLMEQVNAAQKAANELGRAFPGLVSTGQIGKPGGVASLDETGKVPESQLPNMNYDPAGSAQAVQNNLTAHINNKSNPHGVTAAQAGADPTGSAAAVQAALTPLINAAQSAAIAAMPVGGVLWFAGSAAPEGFLVCDGSHFNTATYPALYSVLKKQYLPNLIGKFVKGSETVGSTFTGSYFMESVYTGSMGTATFAPYLRIANPSRTVTTSDSKYSRADIVGEPGSVTSTNKYLEPPYITLLPCIKY